jgi:Icc-related predicted phosphoesterase
MERVAVITDIHANLPALEAVMAAIEWTDVDAVYCGGDLVGYGQRPARTATSSWSGTPTNHAESVARAVAESGLPIEYAEKLVMAA